MLANLLPGDLPHNAVSLQLLQLTRDCKKEDPIQRPTTLDLLRRLRGLQGILMTSAAR